jgi:hypothetical protein
VKLRTNEESDVDKTPKSTVERIVKGKRGKPSGTAYELRGSVPKLHVRDLFGLVRPRTWRFEGFLDWTIIIFQAVWTDEIA